MKKSFIKSVLMFLAVLSILYIIINALFHYSPKKVEVEVWEEYTVSAGDTLWDITPRNDKYDIREIIDTVEKHNNIKDGGTIYPGQKIYLPVW